MAIFPGMSQRAYGVTGQRPESVTTARPNSVSCRRADSVTSRPRKPRTGVLRERCRCGWFPPPVPPAGDSNRRLAQWSAEWEAERNLGPSLARNFL